jgi:hypothetical protein
LDYQKIQYLSPFSVRLLDLHLLAYSRADWVTYWFLFRFSKAFQRYWLRSVDLQADIRMVNWKVGLYDRRQSRAASCSTLTRSVMILTCVREVIGPNLGRDIEYPDAVCGFPQSFHAIAGIGQIRPLLLPPPNLLQFILYHPTTGRFVVWDSGSAVKNHKWNIT